MGDGTDPDAAVAAAKAWQALKFANGFGWLTGPVDLGGRGLPLAHDMLYQSLEAEFDVPVGSLSVGLGMVLPTVARWATPAVRAEVAGGLAPRRPRRLPAVLRAERRVRPRHIATAAVRDGDSGSSTARRSGRRAPATPTSASCSPAPIPTGRDTTT